MHRINVKWDHHGGTVDRGRRTALIGAIALLATIAGTSGVSARAATVGVLTGRGDTWDPSAGSDASSGDAFLAWTLYDRHAVPHALFRVNADPRLQLNRSGVGWAWSIDALTTTAAYQQDRNGNSDLRLYDWLTGVRTNPGAGVNTTRWEYEPAVSGNWLVFARLNRAAAPDVRRIVLYNLATKQPTLLAVFRGSGAIGTLQSPEINGDWVTWTSMSDRYRRSSVHRYQISTGHALRIPHPAGKLDYMSAIGPDGTVYFLRSRGGCGNHVTIDSYTTGGVLTRMGAMIAGRDGGDELFGAHQPDGSTSLYFDSYRCTASPANGNVYMLHVPIGSAAAGRVVNGGSVAPARQSKWFPTSLRRQVRAIEGLP